MNTHALTSITIVAAILLTPIQSLVSQDSGVNPPKGFLPGLIARAYLGGDTDAKKYPTHCVAVIKTGKEFIDKYKPLAEAEIRGKAHTNEVFYCAFGYIVLEQDAEVKFEMGDNTCHVNGKDFGRKTFTHSLKAGKHPIEIFRSWGRGQGDFTVIDAKTGTSVLYHTDQMITRELGRSFKIGGRTLKSADLEKIRSQSK